MRIRKAIHADFEMIQKLNAELFKKEYEEYDKTLFLEKPNTESGIAYYKMIIEDPDHYTVVVIDGDIIVGYLTGAIAHAASFRIVKRFAELESMFISVSHRNKGIGKMLTDGFVAWCKERHVERIRVVAAAQNEKGINFYMKNGFKPYESVLEMDL